MKKSILNIRKNVGLFVGGNHAAKYAANADKKRLKRSTKQKLKSFKVRRLELKQNREILRKNKEKTEGLTYRSNCGLEEATIQIPSKYLEEVQNDDYIVVYFDLETTGLTADCYLLQIAAISNEHILNIYIDSSQQISPSATKATGLHHIGDDLYLRHEKLETLSIRESLDAFQQFLKLISGKKTMFARAHNASFNTPRLLRAIMKNDMLECFNNVLGFSDTLRMFKQALSHRKEIENFKLETLAKQCLESYDSEKFHDAVYDVTVLQRLVCTLDCTDKLLQFYKTYRASYVDVLEKNKINNNLQFVNQLSNVISCTMLKRLALHDITYSFLLEEYKRRSRPKYFQHIY